MISYRILFYSTFNTDYVECEAHPYIYLNDERCDRILQCPNGDDEQGCGKILYRRIYNTCN